MWLNNQIECCHSCSIGSLFTLGVVTAESGRAMDDVIQQQILLAFQHHGSLYCIAVDDGNAVSGIVE